MIKLACCDQIHNEVHLKKTWEQNAFETGVIDFRCLKCKKQARAAEIF